MSVLFFESHSGNVESIFSTKGLYFIYSQGRVDHNETAVFEADLLSTENLHEIATEFERRAKVFRAWADIYDKYSIEEIESAAKVIAARQEVAKNYLLTSAREQAELFYAYALVDNLSDKCLVALIALGEIK